VVFLSDWTDESPARVLAKLKKRSDYYNRGRRTLGDFIDDVADNGWSDTVSERWAWAKMNMSPTDLADISGATYTYLLNGQAPDGNWTGLFQPGERIRLRLINGSAMSYFDFRIPGLKLTVVAADGQNVEPVQVDEVRLAVAETPRCDRRAGRQPGRLHPVRPSHGPQRLCPWDPGRARWPAGAGAQAGPAPRAEHGGHGPR